MRTLIFFTLVASVFGWQPQTKTQLDAAVDSCMIDNSLEESEDGRRCYVCPGTDGTTIVAADDACNPTFITDWDVSQVTSFLQLFKSKKMFNQNIGGWTTTQVTNMKECFYGASNFNRDISHWDTSDVETFLAMFRAAFQFNQDISGWVTASGTTFAGMFDSASAFNQNLDNWAVSGSNTNFMFKDASSMALRPSWYTVTHAVPLGTVCFAQDDGVCFCRSTVTFYEVTGECKYIGSGGVQTCPPGNYISPDGDAYKCTLPLCDWLGYDWDVETTQDCLTRESEQLVPTGSYYSTQLDLFSVDPWCLATDAAVQVTWTCVYIRSDGNVHECSTGNYISPDGDAYKCGLPLCDWLNYVWDVATTQDCLTRSGGHVGIGKYYSTEIDNFVSGYPGCQAFTPQCIKPEECAAITYKTFDSTCYVVENGASVLKNYNPADPSKYIWNGKVQSDVPTCDVATKEECVWEACWWHKDEEKCTKGCEKQLLDTDLRQCQDKTCDEHEWDTELCTAMYSVYPDEDFKTRLKIHAAYTQMCPTA